MISTPHAHGSWKTLAHFQCTEPARRDFHVCLIHIEFVTSPLRKTWVCVCLERPQRKGKSVTTFLPDARRQGMTSFGISGDASAEQVFRRGARRSSHMHAKSPKRERDTKRLQGWRVARDSVPFYDRASRRARWKWTVNMTLRLGWCHALKKKWFPVYLSSFLIRFF